MAQATSMLFSPLRIRERTLPNRTVLAPLCQYQAKNGHAGDWHLVHLGKFALGGFGVVMTEAASVEPRGRINHGDLGIWDDSHIDGLKRVADFIRSQGSLPAIQLAHAGRKAARQTPWHGNKPLGPKDVARGEPAWPIVGPYAEQVDDDGGFLVPHQLTVSEIAEIVGRFGESAARADAAGFDVLEIHGAHGYLIASFLTPVVNKRNDIYGGDRAGRMRFALEVTSAVRAKWPQSKPLFFRVSAIDGADGWSLDDSVALALELKQRGVDVIDCSSGGVKGSGTLTYTSLGPGYQVPLSEGIRKGADIATMAVGLILDGPQAEDIIASGCADLVAIGRQAMYDPFWPHHAAQALGADAEFKAWEEPSGWWLSRRAKVLATLGIDSSGAKKSG
jgi:2,4-dienoyl-CoA reductase-like NADH-dependent reductase (Old Yellow Enzyme family)